MAFHRYILSTWFITVGIDLDYLARKMFLRIFYCKVPIFSRVLCCTLWKDIIQHNPHLGSEDLCFTSQRALYRHNLFRLIFQGRFVSFLHILIFQPFAWCRFMDIYYTFSYNPKLIYLFCRSDCSCSGL